MNDNSQIFTVEFAGRAGDDRDNAAHQAIADVGGEILGSGTFLLPNPPIRDIEFSVPSHAAELLVGRLRLLGLDARAKVL